MGDGNVLVKKTSRRFSRSFLTYLREEKRKRVVVVGGVVVLGIEG